MFNAECAGTALLGARFLEHRATTLLATLGGAIAELGADNVAHEAQWQDRDALRQHVGESERGRHLEIY